MTVIAVSWIVVEVDQSRLIEGCVLTSKILRPVSDIHNS